MIVEWYNELTSGPGDVLVVWKGWHFGMVRRVLNTANGLTVYAAEVKGVSTVAPKVRLRKPAA